MTPYQRAAIEQHGKQLLVLFQDAIEQDPIALCKKLRRIETRANAAAARACNDQAGSDAWEGEQERAERAVAKLLGSDRVWINLDPRGYALKIDLRDGERLHIDWGGYGIVAPEIGPKP